MKNGNIQEFIDHIYYGDELWFSYNNTKYFLEGWEENNTLELILYEIRENGKEYCWKGDENYYPVNDFLEASIFNNKNFLEIEKDVVWIDN